MEEDDIKQGTFEFIPPTPRATLPEGVEDRDPVPEQPTLNPMPVEDFGGLLLQPVMSIVDVLKSLTSSLSSLSVQVATPVMEALRNFTSSLNAQATPQVRQLDLPFEEGPIVPATAVEEASVLGPDAPPGIPPILPPEPPEMPSPVPEPGPDEFGMKDILKEQFSKFFTPFVQIEAALRVLSAVISLVGEELNKLNEIDERLAIVNRNLVDEVAANSEALSENTAGFGLAARALTELRIAGFQGTNKSLIDLISITKVSGQDTQAIISTFQDLIGVGGMQEQSADQLAEVIRSSSTVYGTSINTVVKAVEGLNKNIQLLGLAGGAEETTQIAATLAAQVGEENAAIVSRVLTGLTDANADLNTQLYLGLEGLGDQLFRGDVGRENADYVLDTILAAGRSVADTIESSSDLGRRTLAATYGATSELAKDIATLATKDLEGNLRQIPNMGDEILSTLSMMKEMVLSPFQEIVASMLPSFKLFMGGLAKLIASLLNLITRALGPLFVVVMDVIGIVAGFIGVVADIVSGIIEGFYDVLSLIPGLGRFFGGEAAAKQNSTMESLSNQLEVLSDSMNNQGATTQQISNSINESSRFNQRDLSRVSDEILGFTSITENISALQAESVRIAYQERTEAERRSMSQVSGLDTGSIFVQASIGEIDEQARRIQALNQDKLATLLEDLLNESETGREVLTRIATGVENPPRVHDPRNPFGA